MANNPLNLAVRFFLELWGLFALGFWGWMQHTGLGRGVWAFGLPLLAAALWGIFRVPGDPGKAPVAVPGMIRLFLEAVYFGGAVWALVAAGQNGWGIALAALVLVHYLVSYDRVIELIKK